MYAILQQRKGNNVFKYNPKKSLFHNNTPLTQFKLIKTIKIVYYIPVLIPLFYNSTIFYQE